MMTSRAPQEYEKRAAQFRFSMFTGACGATSPETFNIVYHFHKDVSCKKISNGLCGIYFGLAILQEATLRG